jgi:RimJ/RimL family protein N-acetyltransferase
MQDSKALIAQLKNTFNSITTDRLSFRLLSRSDCYPLFDATRNDQFNTNLIWSQPKNEQDLMQEMELLLREDRLNEAVVLAVCEKYTGTWIGLLKLTSYKDSVRFSLWLHPNYWNTTIAITSLQAAIETIFKYSTLDKVYARVKADYNKVERIVGKMGGTLISRDSIPRDDGTVMEDCVYQLDKDKWKTDTICINKL